MISNTISYGELLQAFVMICGFVAVYVSTRMTVKFQGERIEAIEEQIDGIAKALESVARQDERLKNLEKAQGRDAPYGGKYRGN